MQFIAVFQFAVLNGKHGESLVIEPVVLRSHPAGFLAAVELGEAPFAAVQLAVSVLVFKDTGDIGDAVALSASAGSGPAVAAHLQRLEDTSHHRVAFAEVILTADDGAAKRAACVSAVFDSDIDLTDRLAGIVIRLFHDRGFLAAVLCCSDCCHRCQRHFMRIGCSLLAFRLSNCRKTVLQCFFERGLSCYVIFRQIIAVVGCLDCRLGFFTFCFRQFLDFCGECFIFCLTDALKLYLQRICLRHSKFCTHENAVCTVFPMICSKGPVFTIQRIHHPVDAIALVYESVNYNPIFGICRHSCVGWF